MIHHFRQRRRQENRRHFKRAYRSMFACLEAIYKISPSAARAYAQEKLDDMPRIETFTGRPYARGMRAAINAAYRKFDPSQLGE